MKRLPQTIISCFLCLLPSAGHGDGVLDYLKPGRTVKRTVFPFYSRPERKLSVIMFVDKAYLDHERRGFFNIGILPVGALEGVTIEVRDPATAPETFQQMEQWLGGSGGKRVEMRGVKFIYATNTIAAGKVRYRGGHSWDLLDGVRIESSGAEGHSEKATLEMAGKNAGQLILKDSPETTYQFLASPGDIQQKPKP